MDEIDAIGGRRFSEGTSADREIQRTLMELLSQLDGFDVSGAVKMIMATNRPDVLDPALLRPGRLDRKIEIPLPNEAGRSDILKIHAAGIAKHGDIDYDAIVRLGDGFNGADLRNVCTEAGMFAIRGDRDYVTQVCGGGVCVCVGGRCVCVCGGGVARSDAARWATQNRGRAAADPGPRPATPPGRFREGRAQGGRRQEAGGHHLVRLVVRGRQGVKEERVRRWRGGGSLQPVRRARPSPSPRSRAAARRMSRLALPLDTTRLDTTRHVTACSPTRARGTGPRRGPSRTRRRRRRRRRRRSARRAPPPRPPEPPPTPRPGARTRRG